jgi:protein-tyrosine phosphatase
LTRSILFVCTANRFRSPIAASFFTQEVHRHGQEADIQASSAGTWTTPGQSATLEAIQYAKDHQIDLSFHRSRLISEALLSQTNLVLTMSSGQEESLRIEFPKYRDRIIILSETAGFPPFDIPDPYRSCHPPEDVANEIVKIIQKGYDNIVKLAMKKKFKCDSNDT